MRQLHFGCIALCLAGILPGSARAQDSYYMIVFSSQRPVVNVPKYTHSFGTFVRIHCEGPGQDKLSYQAVTISWLPTSLDVEVYRLRPECGSNVALARSLQLAIDNGERNSMWGPYRIQPDLYERALEQAARLDSGVVRYKCVDTGFPADRVSNCIHALGDLAIGQPRLRIASPGYGDSASYYITLNFLPWIIDSDQTYPWVADAIGLRNYCILQRDLDDRNPGSLLVRGLTTFTQPRLNRASR